QEVIAGAAVEGDGDVEGLCGVERRRRPIATVIIVLGCIHHGDVVVTAQSVDADSAHGGEVEFAAECGPPAERRYHVAGDDHLRVVRPTLVDRYAVAQIASDDGENSIGTERYRGEQTPALERLDPRAGRE